MATPPSRPLDLGHAWLGAVLPADARRLRVADPDLGATLAEAGAELTDARPDVEIGPAESLRGDASAAVVSVAAAERYGGPVALRAAHRVLAVGAARLHARRAQGALRRLGYRETAVLTWDDRQRLRLHGWLPPRRSRPAELLPRRALVLGAPSSRTLLDAAHEAACSAAGDLDRTAPFVSGLLVVDAPQAVLRVGVGPVCRFLDASRTALERVLDGAAELEPLLPRPLAHGRVGLAEWSLERRLAGGHPPGALPHTVFEECVEFLITLWDADPDRSPRGSPTADAEVVAAFCSAEEALVLREAAARADTALAAIPRGFAHGDFWGGNLLVESGGLAGVIDWEAAGPGRLPLIDLFQLRLNAEHPHADTDWGRLVVDRLLPEARSGGDARTRAFCASIDLDHSADQLEALVLGYWLDRLAYQLSSFGDRHRQPRFLEGNVHLVIRALAERAPRPARR